MLKKIREAAIPEEATNNFVLQDFGLPIRHLKKGLEFYHEQVNLTELHKLLLQLCQICIGNCFYTGLTSVEAEDTFTNITEKEPTKS